MRAWISWTIWALLMLISLTPAWLGWSAYSSLPHARALASAYAASPGCNPANLLSAAAQEESPRAPSAAPAGTLCKVEPMTVQEKIYWPASTSRIRGTSRYDVLLKDEAGTQFFVGIHRYNSRVWHDLRPPVKVNVQLVEGQAALISAGATLAQTDYYPAFMLHNLRGQVAFYGLLLIPFFGLIALSIKGWVKKSRRRSSEAFEPPERDARAWGSSGGTDWPTFECPNFQGWPLAEARAELEAAGYKMGRISFIASTSSPAGTIVAQTPPPGSRVPPRTAINFQVSLEAKTPPSNS